MEVVAESKFVRLSPRKLRLVAKSICGFKAVEAQNILKNLGKGAALPLGLVLKQAIGNSVNNFNLKKEDLRIKRLEIGEGPRYKRMDKSHRVFRWGTIQKKTAHIRMVLEGEIGKNPKSNPPTGGRNSKQIKSPKSKK